MIAHGRIDCVTAPESGHCLLPAPKLHAKIICACGITIDQISAKNKEISALPIRIICQPAHGREIEAHIILFSPANSFPAVTGKGDGYLPLTCAGCGFTGEPSGIRTGKSWAITFPEIPVQRKTTKKTMTFFEKLRFIIIPSLLSRI